MFGLPKISNPFVKTTQATAPKATIASKTTSAGARTTNSVIASLGAWAAASGAKDLARVYKVWRSGVTVVTKEGEVETTSTKFPSRKELALPVAVGVAKLGAGVLTVKTAFGK